MAFTTATTFFRRFDPQAKRTRLHKIVGGLRIADTSGLGSGTWVLVLYLGVFLPWGLPLGYVLTAWLPRARMQRLPSLVRARITWILLIELWWTLAVVLFFSASVHEMT